MLWEPQSILEQVPSLEQQPLVPVPKPRTGGLPWQLGDGNGYRMVQMSYHRYQLPYGFMVYGPWVFHEVRELPKCPGILILLISINIDIIMDTL